jgi:hypothetical protein
MLKPPRPAPPPLIELVALLRDTIEDELDMGYDEEMAADVLGEMRVSLAGCGLAGPECLRLLEQTRDRLLDDGADAALAELDELNRRQRN